MSMLKRIWEGHQQAFLMSMVVSLCYMPMTIGLPVMKFINFENPTYVMLFLGVIFLLVALVSPLLVVPCARAFGFTFNRDPASPSAAKDEASNR